MSYALGAATDFKNDAIRALIHALKYGGRKDTAKPIGNLLASYALSLSHELPFRLREAMIVPVPLHTSKERLRGYNQSRIIADAFVAALREDAPTVTNGMLIRTKNTDSQTKQENNHARKENMKNAFALAAPYSLRGKAVILIDDVTTSGATLGEAARTLRGTEPRYIFALTAAKA
jgi:ComF family protein